MSALVRASLVLALSAGCAEPRRPPPRPLLVPPTAAWAPGGAGHFVDCWRAAETQKRIDGQDHPELDDRFDCSVFRSDGAIVRRGRFRLLDVDDDGALRPAQDPRAPLSFSAVEGHRITAGPRRVLVDDRRIACDAASCTAAP